MNKKVIINILIFVVAFGITLSWCLNESDTLPTLLNKVQKIEIDRQAAWEVSKLGGGIYNEELHAIVPVQPNLVNAEWRKSKEIISNRIGQIDPHQSLSIHRQ